MAQVTARKRGNFWEYRFEAAKVDGARKQISKSGFKTKAEALKEGNAAFTQYNASGSLLSTTDLSVADYLDYWLEKAVKPNMAYNTYIGYLGLVKKHIKPAFGQYKLVSLSNNPAAIQDWISAYKLKGYSKNMITNILGCLSSSLNYAVIPCKYIQSNPCKLVSVPKICYEKERKQYIEYVCPVEEFNKILDRFNNTNFYLPLLIGFYLGTRIGETFGIDIINDIDFDNKVIDINKQLTKHDRTWSYSQPKYNSARLLKASDILLNAIHEELMKQQEYINKYDEYYIKSYIDNNNHVIQLPASVPCSLQEVHPICVKENGELLTPESFKYCARIIHHELGNTNFHYHCLRHTHGTLLVENGASVKAVQQRLGHQNIQTTLQTYIFPTEKMIQDTVDIFDKAIAHN